MTSVNCSRLPCEFGSPGLAPAPWKQPLRKDLQDPLFPEAGMWFRFIKSLTSFNIPSSVTYIGVLAFSESGLKSIVIPKTVECVAGGAFWYCNSLTSVTIESPTTKMYGLTDYVDANTGFISNKSKDGRELKALELPGLWNGAMADWITVFVEVPIETFNPVKTVND